MNEMLIKLKVIFSNQLFFIINIEIQLLLNHLIISVPYRTLISVQTQVLSCFR
jgi:hypothetical protein